MSRIVTGTMLAKDRSPMLACPGTVFELGREMSREVKDRPKVSGLLPRLAAGFAWSLVAARQSACHPGQPPSAGT